MRKLGNVQLLLLLLVWTLPLAALVSSFVCIILSFVVCVISETASQTIRCLITVRERVIEN